MKLPCAIALMPAVAMLATAAPKEGGTSEAPASTPAPKKEFKHESVTLRLVADHERIAPGTTFTAGLLIQHGPDYHTYWHSPGLVGLPTDIQWQLPERVTAGPIQWPGPQTSRMAGLTIWGYRRDVVLMCEIRVPSTYTAKTLPLQAKVGWMACAKGCHPNWTHLALDIPTGDNKVAEADRQRIAHSQKELPADLPEGWVFSASKIADGDSYRVSGLLKGLKGPKVIDTQGIVFFCDDNQVSSNTKQDIRIDGKGLQLDFPVSELAPKDPKGLSGVLYHPQGWPGVDSRWLRVKASY